MILSCRAQCHGECRGNVQVWNGTRWGGKKFIISNNAGMSNVFSRQVKFVARGENRFFFFFLEFFGRLVFVLEG